MEYKLRLIIISVLLLCLLPAVAPGDSCLKSLWVDGVKEGTLTATSLLSKEYDRLTIGAGGNYQNPTEGLVGKIDEFAIYDGVLSDARILAHYNAPNDANYVAAVLADNPLLYFRFEDAAAPNGADVNNIGSVDVNGTYIGDEIIGEPCLVAGYIGKAVEFYGADGNGTCIDVLDDTNAFFPEDGDVTIEFWANVPKPPDEDPHWFFQHNNGGNNGYGANVKYFIGTDYYYNYISGGGSAAPIEANTCGGQWRHIVFTYNSAETVQQEYYDVVSADDPCLWLRFNNYDDPCDDSGHDYWVEYGENTSVGPEGGGIGNCIYFSGGAGSYAAAANQQTEPGSADPNDPCFGHQYGFTPGSTTFEFWYRGQDIPDLPEYAVFFNQNWRGDEDDVYNSPLYEMAGGAGAGFTYSRYPFNRTEGAGGWGYANQNPDMAIPLDNRWHHIVFSWEEMTVPDSNQMDFRLCIDGVAVKSATYPDTSPIPGLVGGDRGEMDHIVIGAGGWRDELAGGSTLVGYMDEFAIYDGILDPNRVLAHYEAGLPRNCQEFWDRALPEPWAEALDANRDCQVDFSDFAFANFVLRWGACNDPCDPNNCPPDW